MAEALTTRTRLLVVREIHEDESGAALRFEQGRVGRLPLRDPNYASHLRLGRRSQESHHALGVSFGEGDVVTELVRADNDVPLQIWEEDDGARVLFQGHDGVFRAKAGHHDAARIRALLDEAMRKKSRIWFIAQKPELVLLDVLPA